MKKYPHIFSVLFFLLLATTTNAQFMTPPDQVDDFGLERLINNGVMDLKNLNPVNLINNKQRRNLEQDWTNNAWRHVYQTQRQFAANCGVPLRKTYEDFDTLRRTFTTTFMDSFIYANNRLRTWNTYDVSSNGVRTLVESFRFTYGTRTAPDTVLSIFTTPQFSDTSRYVYTFNANNQLTAIHEEFGFNNTFFTFSRALLTYDARGNLTRHLIERTNGTNWSPRQDNRYAYNASNQFTEKTNIEILTTSTDTLKEVYSYDAQNRLIKLLQTYDGDTVVITLSNHNAQKRPRLIELVQPDALFTSSFSKATLTYQANDSLVANMVVQGRDKLTDPFVNQSRFIFEYCGDAVSTNDVKKEALNCLVFPNPASESLTIKLTENTTSTADVSVVNTMGQVVFQARNHAVDTPLSISALPNGLYVLRVQVGDKIGITNFTVLK
jgi:hypothetical protein